jgi:hypothetical protein
MGDDHLTANILLMNDTLQKTADDSILNTEVTSNKRIVTLMKLYVDLAYLLHFTDPSLIGGVSLRMVEITMKSGLTSTSPLAFAHYGETLTSIGYIAEGCRLGECYNSLNVMKLTIVSQMSISSYNREASIEASGKDRFNPQVEHNLHGVSIGALDRAFSIYR